MIIVTGGAGFIGSNIVKALNARGKKDILVVDDLTDGRKFQNLVDCTLSDYVDREDFSYAIHDLPYIEAVFHQGACTSTTEWDGRYMVHNNYEYSKTLLHYCMTRNIPFIYASSAAIYGGSPMFTEDPLYEKPINVYGYSKLLFDQYVRRVLTDAESQIVGLRYFNVYGPREFHKEDQASVAFHLYEQMGAGEKLKLFGAYDGYKAGEQHRDFIYVDDVVSINLWFLDHPDKSGIFNAGTGQSQTFNELAQAVIKWYGKGKIEYIPFPNHLKTHYQSFTQADINALREAGYDADFHTVETGVQKYLDTLHAP